MKKLTILVTGATKGGIGFEAASELAAHGHKLIITSRSIDRAADAADAIADHKGSQRAVPLALDLSDSRSIGTFVHEFKQLFSELDILVNNAGILKRGRHYSASGRELIKSVNYDGTVELTEKLLPLMVEGGRIVNVTSSVAALGRSDREGETHGFHAYYDSKYALNLYTLDLASRLMEKNITVNAVHPGNIITNIWRDLFPESRLLEFLIRWIDKAGFMSARKGCGTLVYLADSPEVEGQTGGYYVRCRKKPWPDNCRDSLTDYGFI